jgi:catechol 2,3-dioxygenase-like lactoylglutathione lyase family enzyme
VTTGVVQLSRLIVRDLDRSVAFYSDVLGFKEHHRLEMYDPQLDESILVDASGKPALVLVYSPLINVPTSPGWAPLVIQVPDLDEAYEELKSKGYKISMEKVGVGIAGLFMAQDPDGYNLEFIGMDVQTALAGMPEIPPGFKQLHPAPQFHGYTPTVPRD